MIQETGAGYEGLQERGRHAQAAFSYTVSPFHSLEQFVKDAKTLWRWEQIPFVLRIWQAVSSLSINELVKAKENVGSYSAAYPLYKWCRFNDIS